MRVSNLEDLEPVGKIATRMISEAATARVIGRPIGHHAKFPRALNPVPSSAKPLS
jgi:hypothetical protein